MNQKLNLLSNIIFPNITETIEDLEKKYPKRDLVGGAIVCRIAPSPTGFLHTGSLCTALVNRKMASQTGGVFFLRVEDTDQKREVEGSIASLTSEFEKYGVVIDEGAVSEDKEIGNYGPYKQSNRKHIYEIVAKHLIEQGFAYPCFCSSEELDQVRGMQEARKIVPGYYGSFARCRNMDVDSAIENIKAGKPYILRFRSPGNHLKKITYIDQVKGKIEIAENDMDIVLIKSDGLPTYHFAHAVDDHFMRTTHVIRGEEWLASVPLHIQLFECLGFEVLTYAHLPTIMINDGGSKRKLSKRKDKEAAVSYFLEHGYPPESLMEYLMGIINSNFEPWKMKNPLEKIENFEIKLEKMSLSGALFDMDKLNDISKEIIAGMESKQLLNRTLDWAEQYDRFVYELLSSDVVYSQKILAMERDGAKKIRKDIVKFSDILPSFRYFFSSEFEKEIAHGYDFACSEKLTMDLVKKIVENYIRVYDEQDDKEGWFSKIKTLAENLGFCTDMKEYKANPDAYVGSTADVAGVIRVAITARQNSPDIYTIMQILGKEQVINRLQMAIK